MPRVNFVNSPRVNNISVYNYLYHSKRVSVEKISMELINQGIYTFWIFKETEKILSYSCVPFDNPQMIQKIIHF